MKLLHHSTSATSEKKQLHRRLSGEQLAEVAEHVKATLTADEDRERQTELMGVVRDEEAERQRRMDEEQTEELLVDDRDRRVAELAKVHQLEEEERQRRIHEIEEEEKRESDANLVSTGI